MSLHIIIHYSLSVEFTHIENIPFPAKKINREDEEKFIIPYVKNPFMNVIIFVKQIRSILSDSMLKRRNHSHILRNGPHKPGNHSHILRNDPHKLRNRSLILRNGPHKPGNRSHILRNDPHKPGNRSHILRNDPHKPGNRSHILRDELHVPGRHEHILKADSLAKVNWRLEWICSLRECAGNKIQIKNKKK
jgi:hypothetical protein